MYVALVTYEVYSEICGKYEVGTLRQCNGIYNTTRRSAVACYKPIMKRLAFKSYK